ncbi:efflux RND transporter permease subunit [Natronincola ferrireducens]|uniref:Hydrophobic/amphiphilic exporter-1, HAE1 family n=1 Tax=Natronincola ferrireducens TaxID=393762 RepID=A0A1G9DZI4_9FIRM|nr:efflux RND transporter permease subunit [Natronincola ferrireducens]SDK69275.1 hydrophobic/amphiphilic exporter-1, HAE1 family [Natronincola ferrireducens]
MKISSWAVHKPISILMIVTMTLLLGAVSLSRLAMDLLPSMNIPVAVINTQYIGAGPYEIENLITKPIEEAVATTHNVKHIQSTSMEGMSIVIVEFNQGTDMDFATLEIREKIDFIKRYLPEDAMEPIVLKINPNALPIMVLGITGDDLEKLQEVVEYRIKPRIERLEGVASIGITGGRQRVVNIKVDPFQLATYGITQQQLGGLLRNENINLPGGEIQDDKKLLTIRTVGEFRGLEEIKKTPIPLPSGTTMELQDVAKVDFQDVKTLQIAKINGQPSIRMTIQKQPTYNTIQVANGIHREIAKLEEELENIKIEGVLDQSLFIRRSIRNVGTTAVFGGLLAVIILYLFIKSFKNTLIIALAIPIAVIATFTLMYFTGVTLNLLSLGGFALGIGMLVDNGIVVLENIYRFREEGYSPKDAAIYGAQEVSMAVAASTFTTVAVFLPIVFVEGMTGEIFKELALTVTFSLLASLGVSLTLVPMLASKILKVKKDKYKVNTILEDGEKKNCGFYCYYRDLLKWSLGHRGIVLIITGLIFLASITSLLWVGAEYFPEFDEGNFMINISLPHGSSLEATEAMANDVEEVVRSYEDVDMIFMNIGGGDDYFASYGGRTNRASIEVRLKPYDKRKNETVYIMDKIRQDLQKIPGGDISLSNASFVGMGFGGDSVEIQIKGDSIETLKEIGEDFIRITDSIEGTREVTWNFTEGRPQLELHVDRNVTTAYGLQGIHMASTVRNLVHGMTVTKLKINDREHDVIITGEDYLKSSIGNFLQTPIPTILGETVPLQELVNTKVVQGPNAIRRSDQVRAITVKASIIDRDMNSVIKDIQEKLMTYPLPAGYSYQFRGQREQLEEAYSNLILAVILAILLVYMILATQFQSLLHPFIMMLAVPLAFSGGLLGLLIRGIPLSVPAAIGAIVLSGIVVNNGIVLIDYINVLKRSKKETEEAIVVAGTTRLRPIMMTTLTTVLGLLPLAIGLGEGSEVQVPLATVVIGGLGLATPLTLVVLPIIYSILDDLAIYIKKV